ncbi:MAG TPA: hypothetical protein VFA71_06250 [Terriglobales bacterium]|nr:hypothetical protein [Terriglobales bacterium]
MKTAEFSAPGAQEIKTAGKEFADRASNVSKEVRHFVETAYNGAARNVRRLRNSAEDAVEETRHQIKVHPFTAVVAAAGVGIVLGAVTGWFFGRRRRHE